MTSITLRLPYPTSVNRIWRSGKGKVFRSTEYQAWIAEAQGCWLQQKSKQEHKTIKGEYCLSIKAARPDKRRRDIGNLEKVVSDLLESMGVIEDDCLANRITMEWTTEITDGILVTVSKWSGD